MLNSLRFGCIVLAISIAPVYGAELPTFDQYRVAEVFDGRPAPVDFRSHPKARRFRTALKAAAEHGPNFAGHYTILTWGCGTACQELAIIDAENGHVDFPSNLKRDAYDAVKDGTEPFVYRKDSRLLVVAGSPNDRERVGLHYYVWTGSELRKIQEIHKSFSPSP